MGKCKQCGVEHADDLLFCTECGVPLDAPAPSDDIPGEDVTVDTPVESALSADEPVETVPVAEEAQAVSRAAEPVAEAPEPVPAAARVHTESPRTAPRYTAPPPKDPELITTAGWLGVLSLTAIPGVGLILLIIWALGGCSKRQKTMFARGFLLFTLLAVVIAGMVFIIWFFTAWHVYGWRPQFFDNGIYIPLVRYWR